MRLMVLLSFVISCAKMWVGLSETICFEYAEGDKLYVPVEQLDRVTPMWGRKDRRLV